DPPAARKCPSHRREHTRRYSAPAAPDRLAPSRSATSPAVRLRRRPDAETVFGGEVSCCPLESSRYSAETPAFTMIGVHLSISDLRWARSASGRALSEDTVSAPAVARRFLSSGSLRATCSAPDNVSITGFGVPLGAHIPNQTVISKPGNPDSAAVGKSGSTASRFLVVAA